MTTSALLRQRSRRRAACLAAFAGLTSPIGSEADVHAQTVPIEPKPSTVQPPTLKSDAPVRYPDAAIREHYFAVTIVVVVVEVGVDGTVKSAVVEDVAGHGFDEEAHDAAMRLVFSPALRNDTPVAARIKYRYTFTPPSPLLTGRVARTSTDASIAGARVTVRASDGKTTETRSDANGKWTVAGLPPGAVHVDVSVDGMPPISADETLAYAEETALVLRTDEIPKPVVAPAPATPQPPEDVPEDVTVRGTKPPREVAKRTLNKDEIAQIPGTNGDALRSVQSLPGVARPAPFSSQLVVRGSDSNDTVIYVDGTPIPLVYHFGGLSSVLPTEALDRIDFYPGNFSDTYGRGMGGVVDVALRDPKSDRLHAMAQLDLIDARMLVEGPIGNGWNIMLSGRRSWFDVWLGPVLNAANAGVTTLPRYYDYQLMLQRKWGTTASFRATFFGSDDAFKIVHSGGSASAQSGEVGFATQFWRLQAVYTNALSDALNFRAVGAVGRDVVALDIGSLFVDTTETTYSLRSELSYKLGAAVRANVGVDILYTPYDLDLNLPEQLQPGNAVPTPGARTVSATSSGSRFMPAAYTEWEILPWHGGRLVPGVRVDHSNATGQTDVSPRINVRQELSDGPLHTSLKAAAGLFYQPPTPLQSDPTYGQSGLLSNRSAQYDVGVEQDLAPEVKASLDFFYKSMDRMVITNMGNSGEGRAYGMEVFLRYQGTGRFFGWLSYTLSRSERRDRSSDAWSPFQYDQPHVLTIVGSYDVGRGWRLGGRFRFASGNPYTPTTEGAYDSTVGAYVGAESAAKYSARLPPFQQLDVRVDKTWTYPSWKLTAYVDIQNIYNYRAPEGVSYNYSYTASDYEKGLTILPSLGARVEY